MGGILFSIIASLSELHLFQGIVSKGTKIRNLYNQVPHLTQDTNGKVTNLHLDTANERSRPGPILSCRLIMK